MDKNTWQYHITALKQTASKKGITNKQLADELHMAPCHISRLFRLKHCPSLELYLKLKEIIDVGVSGYPVKVRVAIENHRSKPEV